MQKIKYWVGVKGTERKVFRYFTTPTQEAFGGIYNAVIGPFRTLRGASYMADYGRNNPHCQTVADAEELALISQGQSQLCKAFDAHLTAELEAKRRLAVV